jgi:hypothetical protein
VRLPELDFERQGGPVEPPPCPACGDVPDGVVVYRDETFGPYVLRVSRNDMVVFTPCGHAIGRVHVWADQIEVTSDADRGPNPEWTGVDSHGHRHHAEERPGGTIRYPTLLRVRSRNPEPCGVDGCDEIHYPAWCLCPLCGETVHPGTLGPSPFREFIAGAAHAAVDDVEISPGQYRWLRQAVEAARGLDEGPG